MSLGSNVVIFCFASDLYTHDIQTSQCDVQLHQFVFAVVLLQSFSYCSFGRLTVLKENLALFCTWQTLFSSLIIVTNLCS